MTLIYEVTSFSFIGFDKAEQRVLGFCWFVAPEVWHVEVWHVEVWHTCTNTTWCRLIKKLSWKILCTTINSEDTFPKQSQYSQSRHSIRKANKIHLQ